jgi:ribosomal 30S subunit maturation factor RimM
MERGKRASMREGPLAALFRKTEEEGLEEPLRKEEEPTSDERPATSDNDEWLIEDLIGCRIEGVGEVTGVLEGMSCDVLEVGDELIPLVTDAVTKVDVENKVIEIDQGFLGL